MLASTTLPGTKSEKSAKEPDGSDPRCVPITLNGPIPIGDEIEYPNYTREEHAVWHDLFARQEKLLPGRAASEYLAGLETLDLTRDRIPALADVSRKLAAATGWRIARAPGLLDARDFFAHLAQRVFPSTDYIRNRNELDYTPAPDCFHDIFGHTPMIVHPRFANFYQRIGQAALNCQTPEITQALTRIYWFTVEFGLILNHAELRIYGNGIISSAGETLHCFKPEVEKKLFKPELVAIQSYDIWHFQETLFVIESFDRLQSEFERWANEQGLG